MSSSDIKLSFYGHFKEITRMDKADGTFNTKSSFVARKNWFNRLGKQFETHPKKKKKKV